VIAFEWNSLLVRDRVIVHEHTADRYRVSQPGLVTFVNVRRPTNEVGISIDAGSGSRVLWPTRQEIHAATPSATKACAYCAAADGEPPAPAAEADGRAPRGRRTRDDGETA
jgi:hypothetical protein